MRLLDMFCGEGLASLGYWNSGRFSEIVGIDICDMSSSYSFDFIQGDCISLDYNFLMSFDFIHASPPCQYYSKITPDRTKHMRLIPGVKLMLAASGIPHIIENVEGSSLDLKPNVVLNGHYIALPMDRKRYFYVSHLDGMFRLISSGSSINFSPHGSAYTSRSSLNECFGLGDINSRQLSKLTMKGIEQGIPPRMTQFLATSLIAASHFI